MTTASFGALVKHRRVSLGLSPVQVAERIGLLGQSVDIDRLEHGEAPELTSDLVAAVAIALHWPPALLHTVAGTPIPAPPNAPTRPWSHTSATSRIDERQLAAMLVEIESLRDVHDVLQAWLQDLANRIRAVQEQSGASKNERNGDHLHA